MPIPDFQDEQVRVVHQGCDEVWPFERWVLRWSLKRNFRRNTYLVGRGLEKDGIRSVVLLIMAGPWILLFIVLGNLGVLLAELSSTSIVVQIGQVSIAIGVLAFLVGMMRFVGSIRSKSKFHSLRP